MQSWWLDKYLIISLKDVFWAMSITSDQYFIATIINLVFCVTPPSQVIIAKTNIFVNLVNHALWLVKKHTYHWIL